MRAWSGLALAILASLCAWPAGAANLLVNGDFELAGPVGSNNYGPVWQGNFNLEVFGPGAPEGLEPYSGKRGLMKTAAGAVLSGTAEQTVRVSAPGEQTVTFGCQAWVYTPPDNPFRESGVRVTLWVDGLAVRSEKVSWPQKQWTPLMLIWTGYVANEVKVTILAQAEGRSGPMGVAAFDNCSLDISPPAARPNLLVNGGFEQAGPYASQDPGPGWFRTGEFRVTGAPTPSAPDFPGGTYERAKAMMLYTHGGVSTGTLGQFVPMPAGYYVLSLRGHVYLWDELNYGGDGADCTVSWLVDGKPVKTQSFSAYFDLPNGGWSTVDWQWVGHVQSGISLVLSANVRGVNPVSSSIVIFDDWYLNYFDGSRPTTPVVTDTGAETPVRTQLTASWSALDNETGIDNYQYCIGTAPGTGDAANWTDAGLATRVTRHGLSLEPGRTYYVTVRARNYQGYYGPEASSDGITVVAEPQPVSVGQARLLPDGTWVKLNGKALTLRSGNDCWIQERDRSAGIRIASDVLFTALPGTIQNALGRLATRDGERYLDLTELTFTGQQHSPRPLVVNSRNLGGGPLGAHTPGVAGGTGLNNTGLLVRLAGRITAIGDGWYCVDDGAGLRDGLPGGGDGPPGVRVIGPVTGVAVGDFVRVTGVSSTAVLPGGETVRAIRATAAPSKV